MKTKKKAFGLVLAAVLLVCVSVLGTVAYLTSTDSVTNTFTVGKVGITLDEAKVDGNGNATSDPRVKENDYHLLPGHEYDKDPIIHVTANSEDCWLFVNVKNEIADVEGKPTIAEQMKENGWILLDGSKDTYYYKNKIAKDEKETDVDVFKNFTVDGEVANDVLAQYEGKTIVVTGYAVQAYGFETAQAAWDATWGK